MPWMSIIGIGASLLGGSQQADAANSAANAQVAGAQAASAAQERMANQADATQRYFYNTNRADNSAFMNNGRAGNNRLAYLLGLNPTGNSFSASDGVVGGQNQSAAGNALTRDQLRNQLISQYTKSDQSHLVLTPDFNITAGPDTWDHVSYFANQTPGASTVDEAGLNAEIDRRLADQASQAAPNQSQQFTAQQIQDAQNDPAFGSLLRNFSAADLNSDPVYQSGLQFGLDEGVKGLNRQAAASGGLLSGATLKALTKYGNDYASTKANDSFNRFNTNKNNIYNMLAGISGSGQTANAQVGSAGMNAGNNISQSQIGLGNNLANNYIGVGNARGASAIGSANALSSGLTGAYNGYQQQQFMNKLFPQNGGYTAGYGDPTYGAGANYVLNSPSGYGIE